MTDCLFCKIVAGDIPADKLVETDDVVALRDTNAQAPMHVLVIPKIHIATINDLEESHRSLIGELYLVAKQIATEAGVADDGYRVVMNCNAGAGQSVFHIHLHLLAGRPFDWPPG